MGDIFYFGSTPLWSAMDPAGFYLVDVIAFFRPETVDIDFHPGLTMTFSGALVACVAYAIPRLSGTGDGYVEYWVRHRILLSGLLAGLTDTLLLACCHPLFLVLRHFMDRSAAYVGCALFLCSVPVLLYVSRFSAGAWSARASLRICRSAVAETSTL